MSNVYRISVTLTELVQPDGSDGGCCIGKAGLFRYDGRFGRSRAEGARAA